MILLDTHVLVWAQHEARRLSPRAAGLIRRAERDGGLAIAAFTVWEAAWLHRRGVHTAVTMRQFVESLVEGIVLLPLTPDIAVQAAQLGPDFGGDPGDRLITATAMVHGLALVTADERIRAAGAVQTIW